MFKKTADLAEVGSPNWDKVGVVKYDRISVEFNNANRPGGGDGSMNIETGVFTTVTSGYYIITFSGYVGLNFGETTDMWLGHNGVQVEESFLHAKCGLGSGDEFIYDQASRTVVSISDN